jgi:hypothetical protein
MIKLKIKSVKKMLKKKLRSTWVNSAKPRSRIWDRKNLTEKKPKTIIKLRPHNLISKDKIDKKNQILKKEPKKQMLNQDNLLN